MVLVPIAQYVVTDRLDLFQNYPVRVLELTDKMKTDWSLNGLNILASNSKVYATR